MKNGVNEETGYLECYVKIPLKQFTNENHTILSLRIDTRLVPMGKAVSSVAEWWAVDCGITPAYVSDDCRKPLYSFWYSYHQDVTTQSMLAECQRAKAIGFDIVKIVDGWQTDDTKLGYAYCGDWEPATSKIPDMRKLANGIHALGMKYILWYSVPFVGVNSKNYAQYKNMALRFQGQHNEIAVIDPRYKAVRDFLTNVYLSALRDWQPDGIRLDFIDSWKEHSANAPYNPDMDTPSLYDAVNLFLNESMSAMKEVNPDLMFEFRQGYVGPIMRKYGNIFRVADCPDDYLSNRVGVFDLRMLELDSAVHSDMLMWHPDEKPETAALQIINVIFSTMQYSAKLENMTPGTYEMSKFWLTFMKEHEKLLLCSPLVSYDAQLLYTWAKATDESECMVAVYAPNHCVHPDAKKTIYLANGCMSDRILLDLKGKYSVTVFNCMGHCLSFESSRTFIGFSSLIVPTSGLIVLKSIPECSS